MTADVWPVTEQFVAEIGDVDLAKPLSDADWRTIEDAFETYGVLVFPDQTLTQQQHVDFALRFGPIDPSMVADVEDTPVRIRTDIADVSNLDDEGNIWGQDDRLRLFQMGNRLWHTDSSFKRVPAKASLLYMQEVAPVGGHTEFADMRAAWDALDDKMKARIEGRVALHAIAYSRAKQGFKMTEGEQDALPPVPQTLVRHHAASGRTSLYIASHAGEVVGMDKDEGTALLDALMAHATQRQFVQTHRWRTNDLVMWDNRCTMHRGLAFDDLRWRRDAQRATILDVAPTCEQEGIPVAAE